MSVAELWQRKEDLCPALAAGVYETNGEHNFRMISVSPIIHTMYFGEADNARLNIMYREKLAAYSLAINNGEFGTALTLAERPYRVDVLAQFAGDMSPHEFARQLSWVWTDTEAPHHQRVVWTHLWKLFLQPTRPHFADIMDDSELDVFNALSSSVEVYRGASRFEGKTIPYGLSWTLDSDKAQWFVDRFEREATVHMRKVPRSRIAAYFNGRGESEVVVV